MISTVESVSNVALVSRSVIEVDGDVEESSVEEPSVEEPSVVASVVESVEIDVPESVVVSSTSLVEEMISVLETVESVTSGDVEYSVVDDDWSDCEVDVSVDSVV